MGYTLAQVEPHDCRIGDVKTNTRQLIEAPRARCYAYQLDVLQPRRVHGVKGDDQLAETHVRRLTDKNEFL